MIPGGYYIHKFSKKGGVSTSKTHGILMFKMVCQVPAAEGPETVDIRHSDRIPAVPEHKHSCFAADVVTVFSVFSDSAVQAVPSVEGPEPVQVAEDMEPVPSAEDMQRYSVSEHH